MYDRNRQKEENREVFFDTIRMINSDPELLSAISETIKGSEVYSFREPIPGYPAPRFGRDSEITVSGRRTFEAAVDSMLPEKKTAILNFASDFTPGGGVLKGSGAQEECLCRCSTLWPCLNFDGAHEKYYSLNSREMPYLGGTGAIWSPGVVILKTDTWKPERLQKKDWRKVDVITCAAPRLEEGYVPSGFEEEMRRKIRRILSIAEAHKVDNLILGAFGCGAFHNPPELVAEYFEKEIRHYRRSFERIEFAVLSVRDDENIEAFRRTFRS